MRRWLRWPNSLFGRMSLVMILGVVLAQAVSNAVWVQQLNKDKAESAARMAEELADSVASTVNFFRALPRNYQHLVLSQLRDMGGTRFFVSLNREFIEIQDIPDSPVKAIVTRRFEQELRRRLGGELELHIGVSHPQTLHVYKNEVRLLDLPARWAQQSQIHDPDAPPILVMQLAMGEGDWLYLAALLPDRTLLAPTTYLDGERLLFLTLLVLVLLLAGALIFRWLNRPLRRLGRAAERLGRGMEVAKLDESGPREIRATARAFNLMQDRIGRFMADRERLFSAISHDLKTPITRLRLRAELLDDDQIRAKFEQDLLALEQMVKGALDCARGTDIREPATRVDLFALLQALCDDAGLMGAEVSLQGRSPAFFHGKALALRRCFGNLIDNAVFYGRTAEVTLTEDKHWLEVQIRDRGPGIPEAALELVFEPYYRLESSRSRHTGGTGLGLSIARNIVHAHGGELSLANRAGGGLVVSVRLPKGSG
ncbi:two-component sensor histidine kinase [Zobellella denitrificans]|jgi:signal transduction histidine kinase|uniref:ATP-binding protein n=1 Tax=Zobellella denitrificans TaxID=347534 RepID=UPI000B8BFAE2|nr:ATP-binding protein [Zobellella denitrificans]OXS15249.1 two-component sensor histidine kinase [Zobellella denitrificans]